MKEPVSLAERRVARDGATHRRCPECGNVWWRCPGVVINADTASVEGYAYPLACVECGYEIAGGDL